MVDEILKTSWTRLYTFTFLLLGTICPGFLWLALYRATLFETLEFSKLLLLAASLTLPFLGLNVLLSLYWITFDRIHGMLKKGQLTAPDSTFVESIAEHSVPFAAACSMLPLYTPLAFRVIFGVRSENVAIWFAIIIQLLVSAMLLFLAGYSHQKVRGLCTILDELATDQGAKPETNSA